MKKLSRVLALALAMMLLCSSAFAVEYAKGGEFPICSEKVPLTIMVPDNIRIENWDTNWMTTELEALGNFDIQFDVQAASEYSTKLNLMVQSGTTDLPDIMMVNNFSEDMLYSWAEAGAIIPVTEYYEDPDASYYIRQGIEKVGYDFTDQITLTDGEKYGLPYFVQNVANERYVRFWLYQPWLDKLNLQQPTTTEEFRDVLRAVVNGDPNGNGKKDEIGLLGTPPGSVYGMWFIGLMNSFVYAGGNSFFYIDDETGEFKAAYVQDAWKEGLKFIRSLFDEGLIPKEVLTMDQNSFNALVNNEDTVAFSAVYSAMDTVASTHESYGKYVASLPMKGPEGVQYMYAAPSQAYTVMVISSSCEHPEAAFRLGDLICSERFSIAQRWGAEGKDWDYVENVEGFDPALYSPQVDGSEMLMVPYDDGNFWGGTAVTNSSWRQAGPAVRPYYIPNGRTSSASTATEYYLNYKAAVRLYAENDLVPKKTVAKLIMTPEEQEAAVELNGLLVSYVTQYYNQVLAGNIDIDATWNDYLAELNKIGLEKVMEVYSGVYYRMYGK